MRRVLFRWRGLTIWSYPAMLYLGLLCGVVCADFAARSAGLNEKRVWLATMLLLIPALAGARLLWVATHWKLYRGDLRRIGNRGEGGFMMYGGLPCAVLLSLPLLHALNLPFGAFWDVSAFTILLGMMITRVGCFLNGCCAGRPSDSWLAFKLPNCEGVWRKRIPNQLLEALCAAVLLSAATILWKRMPFPGALFLAIVLGYSTVRFGMEFLRERKSAGVFTTGHAVSAISVLVAATMLAVYWTK